MKYTRFTLLKYPFSYSKRKHSKIKIDDLFLYPLDSFYILW